MYTEEIKNVKAMFVYSFIKSAKDKKSNSAIFRRNAPVLQTPLILVYMLLDAIGLEHFRDVTITF
jgi:hypothetical protein